MSQADQQYNALVKDITQNGHNNEDEYVDSRWKDGTPAYTRSLVGKSFRFNNLEVPIITTKRVAWKTAIAEMLWIWQMKSNRVQDLRDLNMTFNGGNNKSVWDEWENSGGLIGQAYGYQLGRIVNEIYLDTEFGRFREGVDQVDNLIHGLKNKPHSRRHVTEIWVPSDLDRMMLPPCVHLTQWHVKGGKLHLEVRARSSDIALTN